MKTFGVILLIAGFAVMNWKTLAARDIIYGVTTGEMQRLPEQGSFTQEDVRLATDRAAHGVWDRATPTFYFSGVAMLVGGVLAAIPPRKQRPQKPNQTLEATADPPSS